MSTNKGRRQELKMLKYKKRLRNHGRKEGGVNYNGVKLNLHCFRTTGKPCSCIMCQPEEDNYNRAKQKRKLEIDLKNKYD